MEYPVMECKEAVLNFWNLCFPAIFAVMFSTTALTVMLGMLKSGEDWSVVLFVLPFLRVGVVAACIVINVVVRYVKVKICGRKMTATVYGYMNDNVYLNGAPAQIVKLLVQTSEEPRFIMYQLGDTKQPYGVNTQIPLIVYRNYFMIDKREEYL